MVCNRCNSESVTGGFCLACGEEQGADIVRDYLAVGAVETMKRHNLAPRKLYKLPGIRVVRAQKILSELPKRDIQKVLALYRENEA